ncbi:MAG TPA: hypothetical protein VLI04_02950 [Nocardioidaceae bacterium]|nr:hypothetical protein [Nocardioidaceae bacterium]
MFYIGNEFAEVKVELDESANGVRLKLTDVRTERVRFLDALELETLVWLSEERLDQLMDPSHDRWRDA